MPTYDDRLTLLERLAAQQSDVGDILVELVRRLEHAQFLHDAAEQRHRRVLESHDTLLETLTQISREQHPHLCTITILIAQQQERMDRLQQTLDAITDLLHRPNGRQE